jgi:hypothetical protein
MAIDLQIIAHDADPVANHLFEYARLEGAEVVRWNPADAARQFTIRVCGSGATVSPDRPTLLRPPSNPLRRVSFDAAFLAHEASAMVWAAAGLMNSPVVNRPSRFGLSSLWTPSMIATCRRVGDMPMSAELYTRKLEDLDQTPGQGDEVWCAQDLGTYKVAQLPDLPAGSGPYRSRRLATERLHEAVVVVAGQAWRCTEAQVGHLSLEQRSSDIISRLGLTLGCVTWTVSDDLREADLLRIEAYPGMDLLAPVWAAAGRALLAFLLP